MRRQIRRVLTLALGWTLVGVGILGLFLPVLQGVLTIALGLYVLSRESRTVHGLVERLRLRFRLLDRSLSEISRRLLRRGGTEPEADPVDPPGERGPSA